MIYISPYGSHNYENESKNSTVIVEMERDGEGFYIIQSDLEKQRENSSLSVTWIALNLL